MNRRIAILANSQYEYDLIKKEFSTEIENNDVILTGNSIYNLHAQVKKLVANNVSTILAKGTSYRDLLNMSLPVPIIHVDLLSDDIIKTISQVKDSGKEIHIIISESTVFSYSVYKDYLPSNIHLHKVRSYSSSSIIAESLKNNKENVIILCNGFFMERLRAYDLEIYPIEFNHDAFRKAYNKAIELLIAKDKETTMNSRLNSLLSNIDIGVIELSADETIMMASKATYDFLGCNKSILNKSFQTVLPELANVCDLKNGRSFSARVYKTKKQTLSVSASPMSAPKTKSTIITLRGVTQLQDMEVHLRYQLNKQGFVAKYHFDDIMTIDPVMQSVIDHAKKIAPLDHTLIIYGGTGTGKELLAQSIHNTSSRANGPFVAVNCAALSDSLLESELFGYAPGAFTGARKDGNPGLLELAHKGTIFLDEIDSMPLRVQSKLLRAIEAREIMRLGSDYIIPIDIRIICATGRNLSHLVDTGEMRSDLFYRLDVLNLTLPPLNERKADILYLFEKFLIDVSDQPPQISEDFKRRLLAHNWKGNIRELKNVSLKYSIMGEDLPLE